MTLLRTLALSATAAHGVAFAQLTVTSVEPTVNAGNVAYATDVVVHFDRSIELAALPPTTDDVKVFGKSTGPAAGTWSLENGGLTARFTPDAAFSAGEVVEVGISRDLVASDGTLMRSAGYHWSFRVRTRPNGLELVERDTLTVRTNQNQPVRVYGGQAADLDDDGWLDLAIVNQDSSDVRVFLNAANGDPEFDPFLTPPTGTGSTPSPNESCDMNGDGHMDIVTGDKFGDSVSVLLGRGDGTFDPAATYSMGNLPRGVAVFDMDGDGDTDVVCANAIDGNLSMRMNLGDGTLGPESTMEGGGTNEWGLASGDMNNDGITDFVVGAQGTETLVVWLGNGDGTFSQGGSLNISEGIWMIVLGDLDGDGNLDVSTGNGHSATGTVAFGDGNGNLTFGQSVSAGGLVVATDLGDLDGDGDLDWTLSAFSGSRWTLYENDGQGHFTLRRVFDATDHPACALMLDMDNDLDLDLALLDEIADEVVLFENVCTATNFCTPTINSTGFPAFVNFTGSCDIDTNDFTMNVGPMPDGAGFFFYGQSTSAGSTVGNGTLCLSGSLFRSPLQNATGGLLVAPFDLQDPPVPAATILPGSTWNFQLVFRDVAAGGAFFNFSDGLQVRFD